MFELNVVKSKWGRFWRRRGARHDALLDYLLFLQKWGCCLAEMVHVVVTPRSKPCQEWCKWNCKRVGWNATEDNKSDDDGTTRHDLLMNWSSLRRLVLSWRRSEILEMNKGVMLGRYWYTMSGMMFRRLCAVSVHVAMQADTSGRHIKNLGVSWVLMSRFWEQPSNGKMPRERWGCGNSTNNSKAIFILLK